MIKNKITPLFLVLVAIEILLLCLTFYYLIIENKGGMALAGVIALVAAIINAPLIFIERAIVNIKGINLKWVWTIEIIIIVFAAIYISVFGISIG